MAQDDKHGTGLTTNLDSEVGKYVVDTGLVTANELNYCREQQKNATNPNERSVTDAELT